MNAPSLYNLEDHLACLVETAEGGIAPELEQQYLEDLSQALQKVIDKRDRVAQFIWHCEAQAEFARAESQRLTKRRQMFERAAERMRNFVKYTIESMGQDDQGRWRRLEGRTCSFSLRQLPDAVEVINETAVPAEFKMLVITVPAAAWERHLAASNDQAEILAAITRIETHLDRRALLARLKESETPGAGIRPGGHGLSMR